MTKLEAFKQTKRKWEWIIEHSPGNWGRAPITCGFCTLVNLNCIECPIYKITGITGCYKTPFCMKNNLKNALLEYDFIHFAALSDGIIDGEDTNE